MFDVLVRLSEKAGTSVIATCKENQKEKSASPHSHTSAGHSTYTSGELPTR